MGGTLKPYNLYDAERKEMQQFWVFVSDWEGLILPVNALSSF